MECVQHPERQVPVGGGPVMVKKSWSREDRMARWSPYNVEEDFSMIVTQSSIVVDVSQSAVVSIMMVMVVTLSLIHI